MKLLGLNMPPEINIVLLHNKSPLLLFQIYVTALEKKKLNPALTGIKQTLFSSQTVFALHFSDIFLHSVIYLIFSMTNFIFPWKENAIPFVSKEALEYRQPFKRISW